MLDTPLTRRQWLRAAGFGGVAPLGLGGCVSPTSAPNAAPSASPRLRLIGDTTLPHGLRFADTVVGGLSGLDYDPARDLWYALSDDRAERSPARFYTLRLPLTASALGPPELLGVTLLRQADGSPFPGRTAAPQGAAAPALEIPDPEAIRYLPRTGTVLWTSEGDAGHGLDPALFEAGADGRLLRRFPPPAELRVDPAGRTGPRNNLAFEGLALMPDGTGAWVAMENALHQDGPIPTHEAPGGPCRFTRFDLASGRATAQRAYRPDAIPLTAPRPGAAADNGVSEILALDADRLLVLERAYVAGRGNSLRLYLVDTRQGTDTLGQPVLQAGSYTPMPKTLMADFASFMGPGDGPRLTRLDNTEGMAWGPRLPGVNGRPGARTLVFVSDDNFNPRQVTQFVAFEFLE